MAWALLAREDLGSASVPIASSPAATEFVTISELAPDLIADLNRKYSSGLQRAIASFDVGNLRVKIGKEVAGWDLRG